MVNVNPANAEMNISSTKNLSHLTSAGSLVLVTELAMSVRVKRVTKEAIERGEVVKEVVGERYFEFENMTLTVPFASVPLYFWSVNDVEVFQTFGFKAVRLVEPPTSYFERVDTSMFYGFLCSMGERAP